MNDPEFITLSTERLILRPLAESDAPALFEIYSNPEAMRYWSSPPWTELETARRMVLDNLEGMREGTKMMYGIVRRLDDALIGTCTLLHFHLPSRRAEIGYILGRPYWGSGYMNEALRELVRFAFQDLDLNRLEADIDPRNAASAKTLERLGFQKEGFMRERWIVAGEISDTWWYGLLRREWGG